MKDLLTLREEVRPGDCQVVRQIVESTGFFSPAEVDVAVELVEEHLSRGPEYGYLFVFAESDGEVAGYTCYGPIACTEGSFDLYWIVVRPEFQGKGVGRYLLGETERRINEGGGRRLYVETSGRAQYAPTRSFYERCGYRREATLEEFYGPSDDKVVYVKVACTV